MKKIKKMRKAYFKMEITASFSEKTEDEIHIKERESL